MASTPFKEQTQASVLSPQAFLSLSQGPTWLQSHRASDACGAPKASPTGGLSGLELHPNSRLIPLCQHVPGQLSQDSENEMQTRWVGSYGDIVIECYGGRSNRPLCFHLFTTVTKI